MQFNLGCSRVSYLNSFLRNVLGSEVIARAASAVPGVQSCRSPGADSESSWCVPVTSAPSAPSVSLIRKDSSFTSSQAHSPKKLGCA